MASFSHSNVIAYMCVLRRVSVLNVAAGYATSTSYSDKQIMTAAGFLEGALSHQ